LVKPPLLHWIQTFVFSTIGVSAWTARLHAVLATLGSILLVGWIARRRFGDEGGVWAAAVMATMPLVLVPGRVGTLDALLSVHVLAAVALDLAVPRGERRYGAYAFGALLGLAFLAKGPIGVVLPVLIVLAGRTAAGIEVLPSLGGVFRGLAAWAVVVLPWGLAFVRRVGGSTAGETLRTEVLERYFAGTIHVEPPWFFAKVVAVGFLPWLAPLALGVGRAWLWRRLAVARTALYASAGLVVGVVFFSLGQSKLATYILPLAPLAAIVITWEIAREIDRPEKTLGAHLLAAMTAGCAIALGLGAGRLEGAPRGVALAGAGLYAVATLVAAHATARRRPRRAYGGVAAAAGAFLLLVVAVVFPPVARDRSSGPLVEAIPALSSGRPLVTVELRVPSLTFYTGRAPEILEMGELGGRIERDDVPLYVLADVDLQAVPAAVRGRLSEIGQARKDAEATASRPAAQDARGALGQVSGVQGDGLQERGRPQHERLSEVQLPLPDQFARAAGDAARRRPLRRVRHRYRAGRRAGVQGHQAVRRASGRLSEAYRYEGRGGFVHRCHRQLPGRARDHGVRLHGWLDGQRRRREDHALRRAGTA
jgi:4-amino-4-deoxy-L-arabinose transferase